MTYTPLKNALIAAMAMAATPAMATVLTFDVAGGVSNFAGVPQNYGDRVTGTTDAAGHSYAIGSEGATPNVVVSYGTPGEAPALWTTGYGDLTNIHFNDADGDTTFTITFTADDGYLVDLYGFDLASYLSAGQTIRGFSITDLDSGAALYTQGTTAIPGFASASHYSAAFATPLTAQRLGLVIDLTGLGGVSDDIGIDNIRFGQSTVSTGLVPEPASWATMILGFGMAGGVLRRRTAAAPRFA